MRRARRPRWSRTASSSERGTPERCCRGADVVGRRCVGTGRGCTSVGPCRLPPKDACDSPTRLRPLFSDRRAGSRFRLPSCPAIPLYVDAGGREGGAARGPHSIWRAAQRGGVGFHTASAGRGTRARQPGLYATGAGPLGCGLWERPSPQPPGGHWAGRVGGAAGSLAPSLLLLQQHAFRRPALNRSAASASPAAARWLRPCAVADARVFLSSDARRPHLVARCRGRPIANA